MFWHDIRLHWLSKSVQHVFKLARLLPDCVQSATFLSGFVHAAAVARGPHAVTAGVSSHCRHIDRNRTVYLGRQAGLEGGRGSAAPVELLIAKRVEVDCQGRRGVAAVEKEVREDEARQMDLAPVKQCYLGRQLHFKR